MFLETINFNFVNLQRSCHSLKEFFRTTNNYAYHPQNLKILQKQRNWLTFSELLEEEYLKGLNWLQCNLNYFLKVVFFPLYIINYIYSLILLMKQN